MMGPRTWAGAASLVTTRLGDGERLCEMLPWPRVRHGVQWLSAYVDFAGGRGRMGSGGAAVVCLRRPGWNLRYGLAYFVILAAIPALAGAALELVWAPLALLMLVLVAAMLAYAVHVGRFHRRERATTALLDQVVPPGAWYLYDLAGDRHRPGAGRALLDQVCAEATGHGHVLYLDTVALHDDPASGLVGYYQRSGFVVAAKAWVEYGGAPQWKVRMVRNPGRQPTPPNRKRTGRRRDSSRAEGSAGWRV